MMFLTSDCSGIKNLTPFYSEIYTFHSINHHLSNQIFYEHFLNYFVLYHFSIPKKFSLGYIQNYRLILHT